MDVCKAYAMSADMGTDVCADMGELHGAVAKARSEIKCSPVRGQYVQAYVQTNV